MTNRPESKIRALIIDDELMARTTLKVLLRGDEQIEIIGECANGMDAVQSIRALQPELLFLDIQMPEMDGFDVLREIGPESTPVTVFVTAYDQYALEAFRVHALDYLLKPFTDDQFRAVLNRAKDAIAQKRESVFSKQLLAMLSRFAGSQAVEEFGGSYVERLAIKSSGRIYFVNIDEVDWVEASDQYVLLHTGKQAHLMRQSMNYLEERLDPRKFLRIHRSSIVNMKRIKELLFSGPEDCLIVLENGTKLRVSRSRRQQVQDALLQRS